MLAEDDYNWVLGDPERPKSEPIILPKLGDLVAVDVMMQTLIDAKLHLGAYFALKEKVLGKQGPPYTVRPEQPKLPD